MDGKPRERQTGKKKEGEKMLRSKVGEREPAPRRRVAASTNQKKTLWRNQANYISIGSSKYCIYSVKTDPSTPIHRGGARCCGDVHHFIALRAGSALFLGIRTNLFIIYVGLRDSFPGRNK